MCLSSEHFLCVFKCVWHVKIIGKKIDVRCVFHLNVVGKERFGVCKHVFVMLTLEVNKGLVSVEMCMSC